MAKSNNDITRADVIKELDVNIGKLRQFCKRSKINGESNVYTSLNSKGLLNDKESLINEYNLIKNKKSNISFNERKAVCNLIELSVVSAKENKIKENETGKSKQNRIRNIRDIHLSRVDMVNHINRLWIAASNILRRCFRQFLKFLHIM